MNVNQILLDDQSNGNLILNLAIAKKSNANLTAYSEICGSLYDGVFQWADHNIYELNEVENHKYRGYIVKDSMGNEHKFVIPKWVLNKDVGNDWKFAKNMFNKFFRKVN
jgi:hypothetical protein